MSSVLLGIAPTRRFCFSVEDAHRYKALVEDRLTGLNVPFINIDTVNEEGLLITMEDARRAAALFTEKGVDAVFVPHVNFGTEEAVATFCKKVGKPVLLWGPRDELPLEDGIRLRDTLCGLMATSNVLKKMGVPFTYLENCRVQDRVFADGVGSFLAAASAVKAFLGARIGQISTRPPNFYTVIMNEQELLSRWGVEMVPITAHRFVAEVKRMALEDSRIDAETALIARRVDVGATPVEALRKIAAMKLFMLDWAARDGLSAIAIRCHEDIPDALECYSCFANAEVTAAGIPVTCETDIHGALSALLLQHAQMAFDPVFFADITIRHPVNDNGVLLWHCGNFPASLCKADAACALKGHCNIPPGLPGTGNHEIEAGEITVCRFDGMNGEYRLFVGEGVSIQGPYVRGTYAWMEVDDWVRWERKLIYGPYIHHVAGARGRSAAALIEACRYIPGLSAETA